MMYQYLQKSGFVDPSFNKFSTDDHDFECGCCGSEVRSGPKYLIYDDTTYDTLCGNCAEEYASDIWGDI